MAGVLSDSIFSKAPVNIELTDKRFKTLRVIPYKKIEAPDFGEEVTVGSIDVYCKNGFSKEHATTIANVINRIFGNSSNHVSFQAETINEPEPGFVLRMVTNKEKAAELGEQSFHDFAKAVSDSAYSGAPLTLELTDETFTPFRKVVYKGQ